MHVFVLRRYVWILMHDMYVDKYTHLLSDAPWLHSRRPGALYSIIEYELLLLSSSSSSSCVPY
jgi:hypothetical protein